MKFSRKPCRIVGVRIGEMSLNHLSADAATMSGKFFLLGEDGQSYGSYTKDRQWGARTGEALKALVEAMEADALLALFDDEAENAATEEPSRLSFPAVPVLGGPKRNDPP